MQYRTLGKTGITTSALGFGCMRFPRREDGQIEKDQAKEMLIYALENGVNYYDTAYPYHNGESEPFVGQVLSQGWREKVTLVTKMPSWKIESADDFDRVFDEQLGRLLTDYVDIYLLHGMRKERWNHLRDLGVRDWLDRTKDSGRARFIGFSFHDTFEVFQSIIQEYLGWDVCQIQYNYMDVDNQAGMKGLHYAAGRGLGVVIMEPLLGGRLADPPGPVQEIWDQAPVRRSAVDWALQWLWSQPEVSLVLSGMSHIQHVKENIVSAANSHPGLMDREETELVDSVRQTYNDLAPVSCTSCEYCLPCPNGVPIPRIFSAFNSGIMYGNLEDARRRYTWHPANAPAPIPAIACEACLDCETKCPQEIHISQWMPYLHEILGEGKPYDPSIGLSLN